VIQADAFEYLPPEPVDVVICEMIHVGMLREKQVAVIEAFKQRYLERFGGPLPVFLPEAVIMAVQPLQQEYDFEGFHAPIIQFQETEVCYPGTAALADPAVYSVLDFNQPVDPVIAWEGQFEIGVAGVLNALRFVTKNVLAIVQEEGGTIDWLNHYMVLPLANPMKVAPGDVVAVSFQYRCGGSLPSLQASINAALLTEQQAATSPAYA
jgi:predicted RNA methylase